MTILSSFFRALQHDVDEIRTDKRTNITRNKIFRRGSQVGLNSIPTCTSHRMPMPMPMPMPSMPMPMPMPSMPVPMPMPSDARMRITGAHVIQYTEVCFVMMYDVM